VCLTLLTIYTDYRETLGDSLAVAPCVCVCVCVQQWSSVNCDCCALSSPMCRVVLPYGNFEVLLHIIYVTYGNFEVLLHIIYVPYGNFEVLLQIIYVPYGNFEVLPADYICLCR
jgi:hypothetical protein